MAIGWRGSARGGDGGPGVLGIVEGRDRLVALEAARARWPDVDELTVRSVVELEVLREERDAMERSRRPPVGRTRALDIWDSFIEGWLARPGETPGYY